MLRSAHKRPTAFLAPATVRVTEPAHLAAVQIATRSFCRGLGFSDRDVFDAVIGVSEFAHTSIIEEPGDVDVVLSAVKTRDGYALDALVTHPEALHAARRDPASLRIRPRRRAHLSH